MTSNPHELVSAFWDENRERSNDPAFWMAHPLCRAAINRRVSGSPHEWPLEWFRRVHAERPFVYGISWGCGLGALERAAIRLNAIRQIDAFDISPASLDDARRLADREGIHGIHYSVGNFDDPQISRQKYDICLFHASLHHVAALERLFRRLALNMKRRATVYLDELVCPSRHEWQPRHLEKAQSFLDNIPQHAKIISKLAFPIEANDPSEAVRSGEIVHFLEEFVDTVEYRPYGGQIVDMVFPCLKNDWARSEEAIPYIQAMLDAEDDELMRSPTATHHLVFVGRLKPLYRVSRPLAKQAWQALRRRVQKILR